MLHQGTLRAESFPYRFLFPRASGLAAGTRAVGLGSISLIPSGNPQNLYLKKIWLQSYYYFELHLQFFNRCFILRGGFVSLQLLWKGRAEGGGCREEVRASS